MFLRRTRGVFSGDLSIDLGTTNTLIFARGQGIVLNEPSVVAMRQGRSAGAEAVAAVGEQTRDMLGRTPQNLTVIRPLRHSVIADFAVTETMLRYFIRKVRKSWIVRARPQVLVCVPCAATQVERRAIRESAADAGAGEVFLIEAPLAAAMGAGLPVDEARGSMVVDMGGGTSQVAVVSRTGIVYANAVRGGGDRLDDAIVNYVRRTHGMLIGEATAERIKREIGSALPGSEVREIAVYGRKLAEGVPRRFTVNSTEIMEALQEPLTWITAGVKTALDQTPPDLGGDVAERGIVLTGGGALLRDTDRLLRETTGLPVRVAEEPLTCVARGSGIALEMNEERRVDLLASA
jgi:rod shape-determining protein MreB and related proteins